MTGYQWFVWLQAMLEQQLLGLLARQPLAGYDLAQYMKKRVAPMWSALPSQIYPELVRLEKQGLVPMGHQ